MKLKNFPARPLICALIAVAGILHADDSGAKYRPQLGPVFTTGEDFSYRATVEYHGLLRVTSSTKKSQTDASGKVQKDANGHAIMARTDHVLTSDQTNFSAELVADSALAKTVFKNGSLAEAEFLVRHCELVDDQGNTEELVPAGTIIGARKQADGQVAFAINGKTPDANLESRLSVLIPMGDEHSTADGLLGAPGPMPVGATWAVNEKAMLNSDLPKIFPGVDRVAGSVALRSAQTDRTGELRTTVTGSYSLGDVHPPFPDDVTAAPSDVRFEVVVTAPVAPGPGQYDLQSSILIHHSGHTGDVAVGLSETDMEVGFTIDQAVHYTLGSGGAPAALASAPPVPQMPALAPGMSSAPILRPTGPNFRPSGKASAPPPALAPDHAAPPVPLQTPAPAQTPPPPIPSAPPPLVVPEGSPFSGAQDLPSAPKNAK